MYGVDLAEWWHSHRWDALFELIEHLPRASRYKQALLSDIEVGRAIVKAQEEAGKSTEKTEDDTYYPPLSAWSEEVELLSDIRDGIQSAVQAIIASAGGKPKRFEPAPRPRTAIDTAKEERATRIRDRILSHFAPHEL